jgi:hypothetical protein
MRILNLGLVALLAVSSPALADPAPETAPAAPPAAEKPQGINPADVPGAPGSKKNANPCRDEVAAALAKLRKSSWFHMATTMITENGPTSMDVDYILPDKMRQTVVQTLTKKSSEVILVGDKAWGNQGEGWLELPNDITQTLRSQMYDNVVQEQTEVGEYACKGKVQIDGRDALSYKLEEEPTKDSTAPKNETYRMFYVDATTGLPVGNSLLAPGREKAPMFKATYTFPLDMKIEPPKDAKPVAADEKK